MQPLKKLLQLSAGVVDRMESRNRAADATHAEIQKDADGRRPSLHNFVNRQVSRRKRDLFLAASFTVPRHRSLCWRKERSESRAPMYAFLDFERLFALHQTASRKALHYHPIEKGELR